MIEIIESCKPIGVHMPPKGLASGRTAGRPHKKFFVRGRAAALANDQNPPPATTPTPDVGDGADGIPVTGLSAQHALLSSQSFGIPPPRADSHNQGPRSAFLDDIHRGPSWRCVATIPTHHMPMWFDDQASLSAFPLQFYSCPFSIGRQMISITTSSHLPLPQ
ncbi:hypothetical protein B0H17DRAFT_1135607 [Mycena rosella]|uniref:Uncharacterized protein n=1 Tax=Mycena rosella TaxID=1033263 RepID=A0AAD7DCV0_MYCRO|nr:hypothetical protein B0H17DRAFT_1135607 [Mycena rosella]